MLKKRDRSKKKQEPIYKRSSIFRRYFAFTAAIVLVCMIVLGLIMIVFVSSQQWNEKTETLVSNAKTIIDDAKAYHFSDSESIEHTREILSNALNIMSIATKSDYFITDTDGNVLVCENSANGDCPVHKKMKVGKEYMSPALDKGFSNYVSDKTFGRGMFVVSVPITVSSASGSETIGAVFAVENAIDGLLPYILGILNVFFFTAIALLGISSLLIYQLCKGIAGPLEEMEEVTRHFAKGEFEHRANENYKRSFFRTFAKALNKMADELAVNEEAQKSFIANVSHELKTPMTTIGGFIDGILDGTIPESEQRRYLQTVSSEVKRLARIVVSMLNLSKIEAGEVALSPVDYDISKQIFDTLLSFERRIEEKHIKIEGFEDMTPVTAHADKDLIQQVIYNLFDNAVKFTPENGTITVFAENRGGKTRVTIRNTGVSVSNEEISRIFERFYKVDKSRSFDVKGVGLGLYIVKTIINMHDGEITASSVDGEYTEFSFTIPAKE